MEAEGQHERLRSVFEKVIGLPPEERAPFLDRECGEDAELRARVAALLRSHDEAGSFLGSALLTSAATAGPATPSTPHEDIGPYRILEKIGEGGFGVVYLAEQQSPIRRRVALKLLHAGPRSGQVLARFEAERQALALMDHPNIAVVHDAGVTDAGDPYFVMEYVAGLPITGYADEQSLGLEERLRLFLQLCEAIQHAHTKGVIHRDLKPSNVLVMRAGDHGLVKVIDFGIAKALGARLTDETLYTQQGMMIGTPEYMSPEQAAGAPLGVDTRSDVYSLGVILYELLVGALPFDRKDSGESGVLGLLQLIRDKEPPKLTTRLSTMGERAQQSATRRRTDVPTLARHLRGDLEWITWKALEKDPGRRYSSATMLAEDVTRYLGNHPILARPPSTLYHLRKAVARHRAASALGGLLAVSLVVLAVAMSVMYGKQRVERLKAERMNTFLVDMLSSVDPSKARGKEVLVRDILDEAAAKVGTELAGEPQVQAQLEMTMSDVYEALGLFDEALTLAHASVASHERAYGKRNFEAAKALADLGDLQFSAGQNDSAEITLRKALDVAEGSRKRDPELLAFSYNSLANLVGRKGQCEEADSLFGKALRAAGQTRAADSTAYGAILNDRALLLRECGRNAEAEVIAEQVLGLWQRKLGPDHPRTVTAMANLAALRKLSGKTEEAAALFDLVIAAQEKLLGPDHPNLATSLNGRAQVLMVMHSYAEAESSFRRALAIYTASYGDESAQVAQVLNNIGVCYDRQDRYADAELALREALARWHKVWGDRHPSTLNTMYSLARVLASQGDLPAAERLQRQVVDTRVANLGEAHPDVRRARQLLAEILMKQRRLAESDSLLTLCLDALSHESGASEDDRASLENLLGQCRWESGQAASAESLLVRSTPRLLGIATASAERKSKAVSSTVAVLERRGNAAEAARFRAIGDSLASVRMESARTP